MIDLGQGPTERTAQSRRFVERILSEFRSPLFSVSEYARLLHEGVLGDLADSQRTALDVLLAGMGELRSAVDDLSWLLLLERGALTPCRERVDPGCILELCIARLAQDGVSARLEDGATEGSCYADRQHLERIVSIVVEQLASLPSQNHDLIVRTAASTPDGGLCIEVEAPGTAMVAVRAAGLPEALIQPLGRLRESSPGVRLGIPVAKELARLSFGRLGLYQRDGHPVVRLETCPARFERILARWSAWRSELGRAAHPAMWLEISGRAEDPGDWRTAQRDLDPLDLVLALDEDLHIVALTDAEREPRMPEGMRVTRLGTAWCEEAVRRFGLATRSAVALPV